MGYIEETGVAQHYRDIRIAPIYEGTNGIQAMDLVGRKLGLRGGAAIAGYLDGIAATAAEAQRGRRRAGGHRRRAGRRRSATLREATEWLLANAAADPNNALAGATPYLRMMGIVTGGWLLTRAALAAAELRRGDGGGFDAEFLEQKLVTARFFATQVLPQAAGLLPPSPPARPTSSPPRSDADRPFGASRPRRIELVGRRVTCSDSVSLPASTGAAIATRPPPLGIGTAPPPPPSTMVTIGAERAPGGGGQHLGLGPGVGDGELAQRGDDGGRVGDGERDAVERQLVAGDLGGGVDEPAGVVGRDGDATASSDATYDRSDWSNHRLSPVVRRSSSRAPVSRRALTSVAARSSTTSIAAAADGRRDCTPERQHGPVRLARSTLADPVTVTVRTTSERSSAGVFATCTAHSDGLWDAGAADIISRFPFPKVLRACAPTPRKPARSSASGTSSTPTASCSAACAPRSPASCAASTSRSSPRTSTPATTSSSSTPRRSC